MKPKVSHTKPHNSTYVILGTVFLWFGWFGFNSGSARLRCGEETEILGVDDAEMGEFAYGYYNGNQGATGGSREPAHAAHPNFPESEVEKNPPA
ncbi:hypothetical protein ID866_9884 [Astraeus odoratus]|nr:hypothetical protein ID866_9884 [Astraeus odoratus]